MGEVRWYSPMRSAVDDGNTVNTHDESRVRPGRRAGLWIGYRRRDIRADLRERKRRLSRVLSDAHAGGTVRPSAQSTVCAHLTRCSRRRRPSIFVYFRRCRGEVPVKTSLAIVMSVMMYAARLAAQTAVPRTSM